MNNSDNYTLVELCKKYPVTALFAHMFWFGPAEKEAGICGNIKCNWYDGIRPLLLSRHLNKDPHLLFFLYSEEAEISAHIFLQKHVRHWPEYSGDATFPVPVTNKYWLEGVTDFSLRCAMAYSYASVREGLWLTEDTDLDYREYAEARMSLLAFLLRRALELGV